MTSKFFILGLGAQKAGTTWLHSELKKSAYYDAGFAKEYHIFDTLYSNEGDGFLKRFHARLNKEISEGTSGVNFGKTVSKRLSFLDSIENYFDYFHYLLLKNPNTIATGDITPSYSSLTAEPLNIIKHGFQERGIPVKVIFLMRDPVERVWSSARMRLRNNARRKTEKPSAHQNEIRLVENYYLRKSVAIRTRYDLTIKNIKEVFSEESVYYGFYETMFSDTSLASLKQFAGLDELIFDPTRFYNASPKKDDLPVDLVEKIKAYYHPVYEYVKDNFGADAIRGWR